MPSLTGASALTAMQRRVSGGARRGDRAILVVEDARDTLAAMTVILEAAGYRVFGVRDGLEALERFQRANPDLVVLDLDVPTISGFRLIQLFRRAGPAPAVPVIVCTAADYEEAVEVVRAGAADLITKPFDARDLLARVDFTLRRSRAGGWQPGVTH